MPPRPDDNLTFNGTIDPVYTTYMTDNATGHDHAWTTYRTITADEIDNALRTFDRNYYEIPNEMFKPIMPISYDKTLVTNKDLDNFARRIYKIIEEHTKIDITEDEFMSLLKGDKDE